MSICSKPVNVKNAQRLNRGMLEPRVPTHARLCREKRECLMRGREEPESHFETGLFGEVIRVVV
jgi:hypothetical protein